LFIEIIESKFEAIFMVEIANTSRIFFSSSFKAPKGQSQHSIVIPGEVFSNLDLLIRIIPSGDDGSNVVFGLLELLEFSTQSNDSMAKPAEFVKCVVWDLDNTLWSGIYSEDKESIQLRTEVLEVIRVIDSRGILNSIASKNNESEIVPKLQELGILDFFLSPKINWEPKSKNIVEIAESLDISLDTFLFIDDSEFELAEVAAMLKQVRVQSSLSLENILEESFLNPKLSLESKNRREMYQLDLTRKKGEKDSGLDYRNFLLNSNLEMSVQLIEEDELSRAHELLSRTNQLNISGKRYTLGELRTEVLLPNVKWISASVNDKYGSYGQVLIAKIVATRTEIRIEELAISCRVAERRVEDSFFRHIRDTTTELGKSLIVSFLESGKNQRMELSLQRMGFQKLHSGEYALSSETILVDSKIVKSNSLS
jgi:FkbH-like protein